MSEIFIIDSENRHKIEKYNRSRLRLNVLKACLSVKAPEGQAEKTADSVCDDIEKWMKNKQEITTLDLINQVVKSLEKYHTDAAYLYEQKQIIL